MDPSIKSVVSSPHWPIGDKVSDLGHYENLRWPALAPAAAFGKDIGLKAISSMTTFWKCVETCYFGHKQSAFYLIASTAIFLFSQACSHHSRLHIFFVWADTSSDVVGSSMNLLAQLPLGREALRNRQLFRTDGHAIRCFIVPPSYRSICQ